MVLTDTEPSKLSDRSVGDRSIAFVVVNTRIIARYYSGHTSSQCNGKQQLECYSQIPCGSSVD